MTRWGILVLWVLAGTACPAAWSGETWRVLPEDLDGVTPANMTRQYLLDEVNRAWERWQENYETIKTPEDIAAYQQRLRDLFIEHLGGFPERSPLNPQVTGVIEREGYRVEKVIFESLPKFYVTAALFLPDPARHAPPYPGVLVPCGHAQLAKAHDTYQSVGAFLALTGMAALVFDPIEQGERMQLLKDDGTHVMWGTKAHTMVGAACILLGHNTARYEIWDGIRAIDYLQSRPEVDPERIGITGNSGGGTQTAYLMALDDRIDAAAPSCFLNRSGRQLETATGDAEQNIFAQLVWGMDHADYLMMRAPVPIYICAATKDFFDIEATWVTYRYAKRMYSRMGFSERVGLLENDEEHNYNQLQREGAVRWLARWLLGRDEPITEPPLELLTPEELWATPKGQVMLLDDARSVYDINADDAAELAKARGPLRQNMSKEEMRARVREIAGIRPFNEIPMPEAEMTGSVDIPGGRADKWILKPEPGIWLPAVWITPAERKSDAVAVVVSEKGFAAETETEGAIVLCLKEGKAILAVDLRGMGETQQTSQKQYGPDVGLDWEDYFAAYQLGQSYVGMRAEDLLSVVKFLREHHQGPVELFAVGNAGVPALHAAALEEELFTRVILSETLHSWRDGVLARPSHNLLISSVHGALTFYDLPDLEGWISDKVHSLNSLDGGGRPLR